jgi:hypothetical protein
MPNLTPDLFRETVSTYSKYGWELRRVLLTTSSRTALENELDRIPSVAGSDIDAAWFSRPAADSAVAWELRYLGETQYALLEYLNENDADFEERLTAVEQRLRSALLKRSDA